MALFCPREEGERKRQVHVTEADGEERGHRGRSTHSIGVLTEVEGTAVPAEGDALPRSLPAALSYRRDRSLRKAMLSPGRSLPCYRTDGVRSWDADTKAIADTM